MNKTIQWLLDSDPWVAYRTRLDLLGQSENNPEVLQDRKRMLNHPQIRGLFSDLLNWNEQIVNSHKNAALPLHKLSLIADMGLAIDDPDMKEIIDLVTSHQDENGVYQVVMNIPKHFGGSGENGWAWAICDAPTILSSLVKLGAEGHMVEKGMCFLTSFVKDNGWPCTVSRELGRFRGPGKKDDPCPYATLIMLKLLSQIDHMKNSNACHRGAEILLQLWKKSMELHPYMFYMGTDFRKLKAPTLWYDIVSVADVLSRFDWLKQDTRFMDMIAILKAKADADGRYTPESEYKAWTGWDFGQKKQPSPWLTFLVLRILKRVEMT